MVCASCGEHLVDDGPMGHVHQNGSMYGTDGHAVVPITRDYPRELGVSVPPPWREVGAEG